MAMRGVVEQPSGLVYGEELLSVDEEAALLERFAGLEVTPLVMRGVPSRRLTRAFGVAYDFETRGTVDIEPMPGYLHDLRMRSAAFGGVDPASFVEALVSFYPPGATIGWHKDVLAFGGVVVGVSLGSACIMRFQRTAAGGERRVFEQPLAARSAYALTGAARWTWQHSIPAVAEERWSVTFRQMGRVRA
ncbi:alpha-ketoglutarate-dependent dioxygenase AlkB [Microbacterium ureisolvens]|uniref:Alpha-ketoglutarate-dependent dioxygenase AlkB n=1 Tax=Microbacterium ureisolvens TaxID=2781186 RepID=A0ABS7HUP5_9MICO|nr:alpha-ketoglutarate-dependent dioxygenase AlkB [Microbacterium ureisolvens]MBW9109076.1 alpha-ketoglutarate-dependent dioxygenase AlkB [Microbacterium ureisolvens]